MYTSNLPIHSKIYVIGYPKSGNTWVSRLLSDLTNSKIMGKDPVNSADNQNRNSKSFEIIKHHRIKIEQISENDCIVYVIRDFRDVLVSGFFHNHPRAAREDYLLNSKNKLLRLYFRLESSIQIHSWGGNIFTRFFNIISKNIYYKNYRVGNWSDHVNYWTSFNHVIVVKYEDLLDDPSSHLKTMLIGLNLKYSDHMIAKAIERQAFDNRKKKFSESRDFKNVKFLRKGVSGDWKYFLDGELQKKIKKIHGTTMEKMGYVI